MAIHCKWDWDSILAYKTKTIIFSFSYTSGMENTNELCLSLGYIILAIFMIYSCQHNIDDSAWLHVSSFATYMCIWPLMLIIAITNITVPSILGAITQGVLKTIWFPALRRFVLRCVNSPSLICRFCLKLALIIKRIANRISFGVHKTLKPITKLRK